MAAIKDKQSGQSNYHSSPGIPNQSHAATSSLASTVDDHTKTERQVESTRTKAEMIARCLDSGPLESLPAEIIEHIANVLRDQALKDEDREKLREGHAFYKAASEITEYPPLCRCQEGEEANSREMVNVERMACYPSCEPSVPLSSTSTRFRRILFNRPSGRYKMIKYCGYSIKTSASMSQALRESVMSLSIRATSRHTVPSHEDQLVHCLRLFPNVRSLRIDWYRLSVNWDRGTLRALNPLKISQDIRDMPDLTKLILDCSHDSSTNNYDGLAFIFVAKELGAIFEHLPLVNVKDVTVILRPFIDCDSIEDDLYALKRALRAIRYPQLTKFSLDLTIDIKDPFAEGFLWDIIENCLTKLPQQDTVKEITLGIHLLIDGRNDIMKVDGMFVPGYDSHFALAPELMPTQDRLQQLFQTLKGTYNGLSELSVELFGRFIRDSPDGDSEIDLFSFCVKDIIDDDIDRPRTATLQHVRSTYGDPIDIGPRQDVKYTVYQDGMDRLGQMLEDAIALIDDGIWNDDDDGGSNDSIVEET